MLRLRTNAGPAVARNAGLGAVRTPLVAFVDTDVRLAPDGSAAARALRRRSGRARGTAGRQRTARPAPAIGGPLRAGPFPARPRPGTRTDRTAAPDRLRAGGGGRRTRRRPSRAIDGFDRALRFGEDVDPVWRLVEAGWRFRYEPAIVGAPHAAGVRGRRSSRQRGVTARRPRRSRRHPGALAPVRTSPWTLGVWGLVAAGQPIAALALAAATAGALVRKLPGRARRAIRCVSSPPVTPTPACLADAGRRCWLPLAVVAAVVARVPGW